MDVISCKWVIIASIIKGFFKGATDFKAHQRNFVMKGSLVPKLGVFETL